MEIKVKEFKSAYKTETLNPDFKYEFEDYDDDGIHVNYIEIDSNRCGRKIKIKKEDEARMDKFILSNYTLSSEPMRESEILFAKKWFISNCPNVNVTFKIMRKYYPDWDYDDITDEQIVFVYKSETASQPTTEPQQKGDYMFCGLCNSQKKGHESDSLGNCFTCGKKVTLVIVDKSESASKVEPQHIICVECHTADIHSIDCSQYNDPFNFNEAKVEPQGKTAEEKLIVNLWDWIVTKSGEVRQITSDDMMDLPYEDIARHATIEEMPPKEGIKKIREIADKHAGVEAERQTLNQFESLPTEFPTYSQYTVLKAMNQHASQQTAFLIDDVEKATNEMFNAYPIGSKAYKEAFSRLRFEYGSKITEALSKYKNQ